MLNVRLIEVVARRIDQRRLQPMAGLPIPVPPGFSELTKAEQIHHLQALWDQVAQERGELPVPESHLEVAEARLAFHRGDPYRRSARA
jgi:N-glycosylase/DNA lyase